jgi:hydroxyacylglutathione hydrolase
MAAPGTAGCYGLPAKPETRSLSMVVNGWFETRLIAPRTWAIGDHGCDVIYLVAGDERALLIDTGWGIGDLPGVVASLTDLPLLVVNTHGHPDHTVRSWQFERVHMYEAP